MTKLIILFKYIVRHIAMLAACCLLSACLGGTIAQQIARSIATSIADKAMARAMDVDEDQATSNRKSTYATNTAVPYKSKQQAQINNDIQNIPPDPYRIAIANTAFQEAKPIAEPLPEQAAEIESTVEVMQSSQLVRVELFNLLIGDEKNAVYEQARLMGASSLPQKREWALWGVATGAIQPNKKMITFLIPPEFGKLPSGAVTMVELASPGELNVARYKAN